MIAWLLLSLALVRADAAPAQCANPKTPIDELVSLAYSHPGDRPPSDEVVFYYACRALVARKRTPCDLFRGLLAAGDQPAPWTPSRICLDTWRDIARSKIDEEAGQPGAKARCIAFLEENPDDEFMLFRDNAKACDIILGHVGQPEIRTPMLVPLSVVHLDAKQVAEGVRDEKHLLGNVSEAECKALSDNRRSRCLSAFYFHQAYRKKNISLCGDFPLCRATMGGGASSCAGLAEKVRAGICAK